MALKLINITNLDKKIQSFKKSNKKIVFTNGCFDLIHPGHIKLLKIAKSKADCLILGLNSDKSISSIKGPKRPILKQKERIAILSAIVYIDYIVVFNTNKED